VASRLTAVLWTLAVLGGTGALGAALVPVGPDRLGEAGSVTIAACFTWGLAARTGGRPFVFGGLALAMGVLAVVVDEDYLRTGAAVMTCVVAAVFAVMATVPAVTYVEAIRECFLAVVLSGIGALATVGFEPTVTVKRFEYVTLALALAGAFLVVYRLGAGLHGLGRRGLVIVVVGGVLVAVSVLYAELLRRYGTAGLVDSLLDAVRWSRDNLGAFPRPIETILGIPALAYGCHMRARRRQGWWVCAFGVAGTAAVANALANPEISFEESALSVAYGLVVGLVIGYVVTRFDLRFTGTRGRGRRVSEQAAALRPEPRRTEPLL
jgi:hypothetical protein